ncbi:MAG: hypothetical protein KGZ25_06105 [Planctomycetes bacterium]|nr:hypothetical protein [Planctomycetota bacterium]
MSEEGIETFEVSPEETPERREEVANNKFLHVTIVDHNPVIEGTDEVSFVDVRIPLAKLESGLNMIPREKFGEVDPELLVQMVEMGAEGELIRIDEEKKSINIRVV